MALTAARNFSHRPVAKRRGKGRKLFHAAVVTRGEMIEHAFYQVLPAYLLPR